VEPIVMVPGVLEVEDRRMRYAVSSNTQAHGPDGPGSEPIWAVNIHGYFAGGGMYWRESSHLAEILGWRVLNPNLPGFAGSDPLPWDRVSMEEIADHVSILLDHVGATRFVLLGHSMGGAVAVKLAEQHPERALGIIYRDGAATPAWKKRHSLFATALAPFAPDIAGVADLVLAVLLDIPDLFIGRRMASTVRGLWPDARRNIRAMGRTLPVGSLLMTVDMREIISKLADDLKIPILPVWGCFDRIANLSTANEFADSSRTDVVWVPGGHSWMLARPEGQGDLLRYLEAGRTFLRQIEARRRLLTGTHPQAQRSTLPTPAIHVVR
jgi:pimeloyl-ACP methyl ester carboxylesterase